MLAGLSITLGAAGSYWFAQQRMPDSAAEQAPKTQDERKVLYWYDPMSPQQKFDKPGKSPFMDMELKPRYADAAADSAAISIDPSLTRKSRFCSGHSHSRRATSNLDVVGVLAFNERDVAVIQSRTAGFVERVYARVRSVCSKPCGFGRYPGTGMGRCSGRVSRTQTQWRCRLAGGSTPARA